MEEPLIKKPEKLKLKLKKWFENIKARIKAKKEKKKARKSKFKKLIEWVENIKARKKAKEARKKEKEAEKNAPFSYYKMWRILRDDRVVFRGAIIYVIWRRIKKRIEKIRKILEDKNKSFEEKNKEIFKNIEFIVKQLRKKIVINFLNKIKSDLGIELIKYAKKTIKMVVDEIEKKVNDGIEFTTIKAKEALGYVKNAVDNIINGIKDKVKSAKNCVLSTVGTVVNTTVINPIKYIKGKINSAVENVKSVFDGIVSFFHFGNNEESGGSAVEVDNNAEKEDVVPLPNNNENCNENSDVSLIPLLIKKPSSLLLLKKSSSFKGLSTSF